MPISNIQTDETYTSMKKYLFLTLLAAAFLAGGGCSSSDDDGWGVIELASPKLKVTTELATATVTWDAVAKTAGYAYALDGAADYTSVDAATTTVTLTALAEGGHTFRLKAVGDLDHTTDSAERTIDFEIDRPRPVPCTKLFSLTKRSKILSRCSLSMPEPVSSTAKRMLVPSTA